MKRLLLTLLCLAPLTTFAVPVDDLNDDNTEVTVSNSDNEVSAPAVKIKKDLSVDQRVAVLERQVANINQQSYANQIQQLQTQVQQLAGKVDELQHQNQQLADQVKTQYQDLDQRVGQSAKSTTGTAVAGTATTAGGKAATVGGASKTAVGADQAAYQNAFNLLKKKDYVRAVPAFQNFVSKYSDSQYVANAHFWLGEIYLLQGQPDSAVTEYRKVISDYPKSDKVQMAKLKLGFAYNDQGNVSKAREQFRKVKKDYPRSTAATMADEQLKQLANKTDAKATTAANSNNSGGE